MVFVTSIVSVGLLFALAIPGFCLKKFKMLPDTAVKVLVTVLLYASQPFLTISSFTKKTYDSSLLVNMGLTVAFSIGLLLILYLVSLFVFSFSKEKATRGIYTASAYMCNVSFMGIPLLNAFFPDKPEMIIYCAIFIVVFNMMAWSLCVYGLTGEKRHINAKKIFLNPPTITLIVALPIFFSGWQMPKELVTSVDFLAGMTTPLSMIILGVRLAETSPRKMFLNSKNYISSIIKVVVCPLLSLGIILAINAIAPLDNTLIVTLVLLMAMPTAASVIIMAEKFEKDSQIAVMVAILSSIMSILTIPLLMMILNVVAPI